MSRLIKLDKFVDSRGWSLNDIYSMFNPKLVDAKDYQINYSILYPGIVKAWHRHKHQDDYFCILKGMAQVGLYSKEKGIEKHFIGEQNPAVVHVKAGEWHGLTAVGNEPCGLLYLVTKKYNSDEPDEERASWNSFGDDSFWYPEWK